jgi:hypothetical protein
MDHKGLDAMKKLEELKRSAITNQDATEQPADEASYTTNEQIRH